MFEQFPYTNFHDLNLDWIVKIAKDFLDQYTHIQDVISQGLTDLDETTHAGLSSLTDKHAELEALLQEWYNTHSSDIANQLADALQDISAELTTAINSFNAAASNKGAEVIASIPSTYTELFQNLNDYMKYIEDLNNAVGITNLHKTYDIQSELSVDTTRIPFTAAQGDILKITFGGAALTNNPHCYVRYNGSDTFTYIREMNKDTANYLTAANDIIEIAFYCGEHGTGSFTVDIERMAGNNIQDVYNDAAIVWTYDNLKPVSKTIKTYAANHGNDYLQYPCNIPAFTTFWVKVHGSAFTGSDVALYFFFEGESDFTYIGSLPLNENMVCTAGKNITKIGLYGTGMNANENVTCTYCINKTAGAKDASGNVIASHHKNLVRDQLRCGSYDPFLTPKINHDNNAYVAPFPVQPNTAYTLSTSEDASDSNAAYYIMQFDSNHVRLSHSEGVNKNRLPFTIITSSNTAYIGLMTYSTNGWNTTIPTWIQLEEGAEATEYEDPYSIPVNRLHRLPEYLEDNYGNTSRNLIKTDWICGQYTNDNGFVIKNTGNNAVIQPFEIKPDTPYTISFPYDANHDDTYFYYAFLDESMNVLTVTGMYRYNLQQFQEYVVTSPSNAKYAGLQTYTGTGNNAWHESIPSWVQFEEGTEATAYVHDTVISHEYDTDYPQLPDYYRGYMAQKAKRINDVAISCASNSDIFLFITDQHWLYNRRNSGKMINYLNKYCFIPEVINGGDTDDLISVEYVRQLKQNYDQHIHYVMGNHEWFANDRNKLYYMTYGCNTDQRGNNTDLYYYVDNEQTKTRHIYLNSYMNNGTSTQTIESGYTAEERAWLENTALNVPSDWSIVIFTHAIDNGNTGAAETKTIIDNAKRNGKDIIAIFQGHAHFDTVNHTTLGIPIIVTTCDKNQPYYNEGVNTEPWLNRDRTSGTVHEQAFDVVIIDKTNRVIHAIRLGGLAMNNTNVWSASDPNFTDTATLEERTITY